MAVAGTEPVENISARVHLLEAPARAVWHPSAPATVRQAYRRGDAEAGWSAWVRHLRGRKRPADPVALVDGSPDPLLWALPPEIDPGPLRRRLSELSADARSAAPPAGRLEDGLLRWLGESVGGTPDRGAALETLAWGRAAARLAPRVSAEAWWSLLDHLLATAREAADLPLDEDPLLHQLLAGELPLVLAYLLPEIKPCRDQAPAGRRAVWAGMDELLDGQGLPHARCLDLLRPLLASWTRCRATSDGVPGGAWKPAAETQYQWLVRQALRLARHDGSHVFSPPGGRGRDTALLDTALLDAALEFGGDADDWRIAADALPFLSARDARPADTDGKLPKPANHSAWAATAVLRSAWTQQSERLTVTYHGLTVRLEAAVGRDVLLSGTWEFEVRRAGRIARPVGTWEEICWMSDRDVDYVELEIDLEAGLRVQRHMLLGRRDGFLLLADAVLGNESGPLEYRGRLPLWPGVAFQGANASREGFLAARRRRLALVMPIALPEWRGDARTGELGSGGDHLELFQASGGPNLFAPLWFDVDRRRMTGRLTWRHLTVGEARQAVPAEMAAGYRVQVGPRQWILYRTLGPRGNRTLLGHNLSTEMLVARFDRSGEVDALIEIE